MAERDVTRRNFVGAALMGTMGVAAASLLGGCSAPAPAAQDASDETWNEETDVVVVGSGAGGQAAALEAAQAGASVIMLEKGSVTGGDSALCDGILGGWGTRLAKEQGVNVTADEVYEWFTCHPDWYGPFDPEVTRLNADKCGETIDWLQDLGVPFEPEVKPKFGYTELPVIHIVDGKGATMMQVLNDAVNNAGVKTMMETAATKLVMDEEGRVIGVVAAQGKDVIRIKANKGVVMASGGYGGSSEMLTSLNAETQNLMAGAAPTLTGDSVAMAMEAGVLMSRTSNLPLMSSLAGLDSKSIVNLNYGERLHGLWLDANGERFFNEETPYENPNGHRAILRKQNEQGSNVFVLLPTTPELETVLSQRELAWVKGDTVEDVAAQIGLDPAKVKATVDHFNEMCAAGEDTDFGRPAEFMIPMTGPFYASAIVVSTTVTVGGIKTNAEAQALRLKNPADSGPLSTVVPGLYAAGEACEWNCAAGWTVLSAMTMGRIAGQNVAKG